MRLDSPDYPGEHFAFDGKDVTIGRFIPGNISPLAEFINRFDDIMKAGLLGGALSTAWPLLNIRETQPRLKYKKAKLTGRLMHALEYRPREVWEILRSSYFLNLKHFTILGPNTSFTASIRATIPFFLRTSRISKK